MYIKYVTCIYITCIIYDIYVWVNTQNMSLYMKYALVQCLVYSKSLIMYLYSA